MKLKSVINYLLILSVFSCASKKDIFGTYQDPRLYNDATLILNSDSTYTVKLFNVMRCKCYATGTGNYRIVGNKIHLVDQYLYGNIPMDVKEVNITGFQDSFAFDTLLKYQDYDFPMIDFWQGDSNNVIEWDDWNGIEKVDSFRLSYWPSDYSINRWLMTTEYVPQTNSDSAKLFVLSVKKPLFREYYILNDTLTISKKAGKLYLQYNDQNVYRLIK